MYKLALWIQNPNYPLFTTTTTTNTTATTATGVVYENQGVGLRV